MLSRQISDMKLKELSRNQIKEVFEERMVDDFPPDELKPLNIMYLGLEAGTYECLGLFDKEEIVGYAFLVKSNGDYLVDYLATYKERRNAGLGGVLIKLLCEYLNQAKSILVEVENPDYASSEEDRELQTRRLNFYIRNGFRMTGAMASCFKVPFIIIETGEGLVHTKQEIEEIYCRLYRTILPKELYDNNIIMQ